jgi:hypothetical protein
MSLTLAPFSELLAGWRRGQFEPGLEPFADALLTAPAVPRIADAGPCVVKVFNGLMRRSEFISQAAQVVLGYSPNMLINNNFNFYEAYMHPADLESISNRGLRHQMTSYGLTDHQRRAIITQHYYRLCHPSAPGLYRHYWAQDAVLTLTPQGAPHFILCTLSPAEGLPDLAERLERQAFEDTHWVSPFLHLRPTDFRPYFSETEAQLLYLFAQGKGTVKICEEMGQTMPVTMRILKDLLARTGCYSVAEVLHRGVWQLSQRPLRPIW